MLNSSLLSVFHFFFLLVVILSVLYLNGPSGGGLAWKTVVLMVFLVFLWVEEL